MKIENVMRKLRILKVVNGECSYFKKISKLVLLYSHAKYVLQSVNVGTFKPLKSGRHCLNRKFKL